MSPRCPNTERQEAINSMFRWYRDAAKCYVYLSDVSISAFGADDKSRWEPALRKSRWSEQCRSVCLAR